MDQAEGREVIHSDPVLVNGAVTPLTLTAGGELRWSEGGRRRCLAAEKEVLGFSIEGSRIKIRAVVKGEDEICCLGTGEGLIRKSFVFEPPSEASLRLWRQKLQQFMDSLGRPKRLLVLNNPFGGKKYASKIFVEVVKPLLEDANIEFTVEETTCKLHANDFAKQLDISKYDGIVCVSGDGILVEVINGLLEREDWKSAIRMPLGVVPAGTGNGMVKSLLDSVGDPCTPSNAILAIIRGHTRSLDVATILQGETRFFIVLMLAWGLVADIDIESEKYRWMGSARLDFYGLQRILHLRKYDGRIFFVPAPGFEAHGEACCQKGESRGEVHIRNPSQGENINVQKGCYCGPKVDVDNLSWRMLDGPFVSIWLHNVPWGAEDTMAAPDAKFSDGYLDLVIMRNIPRLSLLTVMTNLDNGGHVKSPHVLYLKVKAFILEPGPRTEEPTKGGIIDADGEVLARGQGTYKCEQKSLMAYDKLQITVDQGLATLFTPI